MNTFINILAAFPGSGQYVNGQLYELATTLDVRPNRISFEDATGMVHHFLNCAVQAETVDSDAAESFTSPVIDKALTCLSVSLCNLNGIIIAEHTNVRNLDFNDPSCDVSFVTQDGCKVKYSGAPIVINEVWVDKLPSKYIQDAAKEALTSMLDELIDFVTNALKEKCEGQLDERITAMLPTAFVQHLLDNGNGFNNAHEALPVILLPALFERLTGVYNGGNNGSDDGGGNNGGSDESKRYDKYPTFAPLPADTTVK